MRFEFPHRSFSTAVSLILLVGMSSGVVSRNARSDDDKMKAIVALGPCVTKIKKKDGKLVSCLVVAQAEVSRSLGPAEGNLHAQKKADMNAKYEFVKFLKTHAMGKDTKDGTLVLKSEGSESNGQVSHKVESSNLETTKSVIETAAEGMVSGLELIHRNVNSENHIMTLVYGWSAENAAAASTVGQDQQEDESGEDGGESTVKDESATSDSASDYLK